MSSRLGRFVRQALLVSPLTACGAPPFAYAELEGTWRGDGLVVAAEDDSAIAWSIALETDRVQPGEYLLFFSSERPTRSVELAAFEREGCTKESPCDVPGMGRYLDGVVLTSAGRLVLRGAGEPGESGAAYFTVLRRSSDGGPVDPDGASLSGTLGAGHYEGCFGGGAPEYETVTLPSGVEAPPSDARLEGVLDAPPGAEGGAEGVLPDAAGDAEEPEELEEETR